MCVVNGDTKIARNTCMKNKLNLVKKRYMGKLQLLKIIQFICKYLIIIIYNNIISIVLLEAKLTPNAWPKHKWSASKLTEVS